MNAGSRDADTDRASSDRQLLQRWRDGDARAGNLLFRRHFRDMYRFFHHKVGADADDLIQATFFNCVRARDQFEGRSSFRTYLYRVARNVLYAYYRDRGRRRVDFSATSLADLGTSPSLRVERDERRALLARVLSELPLRQQLLLELYYWEEMNAAELAVIFEIATPTARCWLFRARKELAKRLAAVHPDEPLTRDGAAELDAWARSLRAVRPADPGARER